MILTIFLIIIGIAIFVGGLYYLCLLYTSDAADEL